MTIGRIDINEKDLPKISGGVIQLQERADEIEDEITAIEGDITAIEAEIAAIGVAAAAIVTAPGGRLTLQTLTPVMTTTQSAKTTIYYTPYNGSTIQIYGGSKFTGTAFSELSNVTTASSVGNAGPAAVAANSNYDLFVWSNGGTMTLTRGPAWTSDTARSAGTALVMVSGVLLNSVSITNGPAASRGTYVGTIRSNASSQLDWILGAVAANGTAGVFGVWNCYNRCNVASFVGDNTSSWTYGTNTIRAANNSPTMRVSFVRGLDEDAINAVYDALSTPDATVGGGNSGPGLDSTSAMSGTSSNTSAGAPRGRAGGSYWGFPGIGYHFVSANELAPAGTSTFWGLVNQAQSGLLVEFKA